MMGTDDGRKQGNVGKALRQRTNKSSSGGSGRLGFRRWLARRFNMWKPTKVPGTL